MRIKLMGLFVSCALTITSQTGVRETDNKTTATLPTQEQIYDQRLHELNTKTESLDCFSSVDVPLTFHDSVYISRLHSLGTDVNLKFNPIVREHIERYTKNTQNQVSNLLEKSKYYFPLFEEILDREGIPLELKYLPIVESALNATARSHAGASGIWQFMLVTGKSYGLEVNSLVDERCDPVKSTTAAAKYLKDLYYIYDDWSLVLAAYNCGPANVNKAIYRSGGKTDYWDIYPHLPKETRNYVPAFIAATYVMNYHNEHNICPARSNYFLSMDSVKINKNIRLQHVANVINVPLNELRRYNPQFKGDIVPGGDKEYVLNLPAQKILSFVENEDAIYSNKKPRRQNTQELFAHKSATKEADAISFAFNDESDPLLEAREVTIIHKVVRGDNLIKIAKRNNVTVVELKKWNNIKKNYIKPGKELKIQKIEYFAVEPKLKEPELMTISIDPSSNLAVIDNYLQQLDNEISQQRSLDSERASDELRLVAAVNNYDFKTTEASAKNKKKNINVFNSIANLASTTYHSVKGWGESQFGKFKGERTVEYYAEKKPEVHPEVKKETPEIIAEIQPPAPKVEKELYSVVANNKNTASYANVVFNANARKVYHKVRIGETVTRIATHYKVSKDDIIVWNNLTSGMAKITQRLLIYLPNKDEELANIPL